MNPIGEQLQKARFKKEYSKSNAASKLGMTRSRLATIEKGYGLLTLDELIKIAELYQVKIEIE